MLRNVSMEKGGSSSNIALTSLEQQRIKVASRYGSNFFVLIRDLCKHPDVEAMFKSALENPKATLDTHNQLPFLKVGLLHAQCGC